MKGHLARSVCIIGTGYTPLGIVGKTPALIDMTERELFSWACLEAMENGGIQSKDIDAYYVGMSGPNFYSRTKSAAPHFGAWIGMEGKPTLFHDEGCGTSAFGLQMAVQAVASGVYDCVISGAVNISSTSPLFSKPPFLREQLDNDTLWNGIYTAFDPAHEKPGVAGVTSADAMVDLYCRKYGYSASDVEDAAVKYLSEHRKLALKNPKSTMFSVTYEEEAKQNGFSDLKSYLTNPKFNPLMGSYIRSRYMGLSCDGAAAVIVCAKEVAYKYTKKPIEIAGVATAGCSTKTYAQLPTSCDVQIFKDLYSMAGITDPYRELDWMSVHDCPLTNIFGVAEAAGFVREGEAMKYMLETGFGADGDKHINTCGGRSQLGHPLSPAFNVVLSECVDQMRGEAGDRQLTNPPRASVCWILGSGLNVGACVLKAPR